MVLQGIDDGGLYHISLVGTIRERVVLIIVVSTLECLVQSAQKVNILTKARQ